MTIQLRGDVRTGGDKSISHRAVMLAALAKGLSRLTNLAQGNDVKSTLRVYEKLGLRITANNGTYEFTGGGFESLRTEAESLHCGNSGTTLRISIGIIAGTRQQCRLLGDDSLNRRPVRRVIEPIRQMGGNLATVDASDRPPVVIRGQRLHGINISTSVASAQVKSAILFAGLNADGVTSVTEPEKSRDHTEIMLKHLGCNIDVEGRTAILSPVKRIDGFTYTVPGDLSTAMFLIVAALIIPGSVVVVRDVLLNPTRTGGLDILRAMGADIQEDNIRQLQGERVGDLIVRASQLRGHDAADIVTARYIDEVPALAIAGMFAEGETIFRNIGELRVKESDRAQGIADIVTAFGGNCRIEGDDVHITGGRGKSNSAADHLGDHRLAMMMEVLELAINDKINGGYGDVISVSAPEFYDILKGVIN